DGRTKTSLIAAIVAADPRPMRDVQPLAPIALEKIVLGCLAKDPEDRWQSAADVRHALELVGSVSSTSFATPAPARTRRWLVPAVLAIAFALIAAAAYLLGKRGAVVADRALQAWILPPAGQEFGYLNYALTISPDAQWVTFTLKPRFDTRLWIRRVGTLEAKPLPGTENAFMPMWSPDSREIAFFNGEKLKKVTIEGAPPVTICDAQPKARLGAWTSSGDIVFSAAATSGLFRVKASGGTPEMLTKLDASRQESTHRWAFFLPDGRHFLYLGANHTAAADSEVHAIFASSLDNPAERKLIVHARSNVAYARGHLIYARANTLVAQPFDASKLELTGEPFPIAANVEYDASSFLATFAVAANGTVVYRTTPDTSKRQLAWVDVHGAAPDVPVGEPGAFREVRVSRDGTRAAEVIAERDTEITHIAVENFTTGRRVQLTPNGAPAEFSPVWSPDGRRIAFTRGEAFGGDVEIWIADADGSNERQLTHAPETEFPTDWSPDGSFLIGFVPRDLANDRRTLITRWNVADGKSTTFMSGYNPAVSPDGNWFIYGERDPEPSVWVAKSADGSARQKLSRTTAFAGAWIDDGIIMSAGNDVHLLRVQTTPSTITVGEESTLAKLRTDIVEGDTRDGKRFLAMMEKNDASDQAISLLTDFLAGKKSD
ncbi:MAG TPA: hypothetical protein VJZ00_12770, partial [Thermoanaerobaculia bacterium]|nr:hypothetical protein [Thermoanaerobaculia bacterium]